jgi:hypothetical protein
VNSTVTAATQRDFFQISPVTNRPVKVHAWNLAQSSEVGDAQEEGLLVTTVRGVGSTSGSGGGTGVVVPISVDEVAAGSGVQTNNTTKMTTGVTEIEAHVWNVRVPYTMIYTPEMRPYIKGGDRWALELSSNPVDDITISGTIWFEEVS